MKHPEKLTVGDIEPEVAVPPREEDVSEAKYKRSHKEKIKAKAKKNLKGSNYATHKNRTSLLGQGYLGEDHREA